MVRAAEDACGNETVKQWLQSGYACGDDDGVAFDAGPDSDVGGVVCMRKSASRCSVVSYLDSQLKWVLASAGRRVDLYMATVVALVPV